MTSVRMVEKPC